MRVKFVIHPAHSSTPSKCRQGRGTQTLGGDQVRENCLPCCAGAPLETHQVGNPGLHRIQRHYPGEPSRQPGTFVRAVSETLIIRETQARSLYPCFDLFKAVATHARLTDPAFAEFYWYSDLIVTLVFTVEVVVTTLLTCPALRACCSRGDIILCYYDLGREM